MIACVEKGRQVEIVSALGMKPKPDSATGGGRIQYISKLLALLGLKFAKPEQKMINGVRERVYHINSEVVSDPCRLAILEAIEKKMTRWMAEKSKVDWNEQPLAEPIQEIMSQWTAEKNQTDCTKQPPEQPTPSPAHTASCTLHTTTPLYKDQGSDVQARIKVQQAFTPEQPNPIPPEINTSPDLHTTSPFIKGQVGGVQAEIEPEQAFNLEEWMTPESLEDITQTLELVAETDGSEAVEMLKDVRACMPVEALKAAANLRPKPLRNRIAEMVRSLNTPVEVKPTYEQKPVPETAPLPQVTKTKKPPAPPLSKDEEAYAEWSQLHKLIEVANEFLSPLAQLLPDQAIERIKHLLTFVPSKAVSLAAELLTGSPRDNLKPLLLTFDIAID